MKSKINLCTAVESKQTRVGERERWCFMQGGNNAAPYSHILPLPAKPYDLHPDQGVTVVLLPE